MKERPTQFFTDEYLVQSALCSPTEIAQFLEDMRILGEAKMQPQKSKLISIKIPEILLAAFKKRCELEGVRYQSKIKDLMKEFLIKDH